MLRGTILDANVFREEIAESHRRSQQFGVSATERSNQPLLTPAELGDRQMRNRELLEVVREQVDEFYNLLSADEFMFAVVDVDGYILQLSGSDSVKAKFAERNCAPGYRWTEKDVGTSAISLCLKLQRPVQLNDKDHFCKRAYGFTSSAAPVFGQGGELRGVLVVSGSAELVHPHTLFMIASAARSVERELRVLRRNRELALHVSFLDGVVESTGTGLMVLDSEARIWRVNRKGKQIVKMDDLQGKPVSVLNNMRLDPQAVMNKPSAWINRETTITCGRGRAVHCIFSAQPVISSRNELLGIVITFEEIDSMRKLATNIVGTRPFFTFESLIGSCPAFKQAIKLARKAAQNASTVLIQGETGTGKELFAQAIHNASDRANKPFIPINCGAIPGELLESELFGYVDGAFTGAQKGGRPGKFELASGGTVLLDEIGDMPHDMQVKLLRVLQTGEVYRIGDRKPVVVDARIVACTHVDLSKAVRNGTFREDLYYRLNVFPITIPSLRSRGREDISALAAFFLARCKGNAPKLSENVLDAMCNHDWPGNVRELENAIQRGVHLCEDNELDAQCMGLTETSKQHCSKACLHTGTIEEMERSMIAETLERTGGNMAVTAKTLGISRATLYRKVERFGLQT